MLPVTDDNFCCTVCSTLRFASLNAAATRSSSISLSSPSNESSIVTRRTSCLHVTTTFTMPPPATPSTSVAASSSWAFCMLACISCACRINWLKPFIGTLSISTRFPSLARTNAVRLERGVERGLNGFDVRVVLDRFARLAHSRALVGAARIRRRRPRRLSDDDRELRVAAVLLAQRRLETRAQLLRVQVLFVGGQHELPRAAGVRLQVAIVGQLARRTAQVERLDHRRPVRHRRRDAVRPRARLRDRRRLRPRRSARLRAA